MAWMLPITGETEHAYRVTVLERVAWIPKRDPEGRLVARKGAVGTFELSDREAVRIGVASWDWDKIAFVTWIG